jgi:hypothetical protein
MNTVAATSTAAAAAEHELIGEYHLTILKIGDWFPG